MRHPNTKQTTCRRWPALLVSVAIALTAAGCKRQSDGLAPEGKDALNVSAVGHLGSNVGISGYYINGNYFGNVSGWGGGGSFSCCVLVTSKNTKPIVIHVRWTSCDTSHIKFENDIAVDPHARCKLEEHEADVPVHFADESGATLYIHFLPEDRVEAWVSSLNPIHVDYAGPPYPRGPAPLYKPKVDRQPAAVSDK